MEAKKINSIINKLIVHIAEGVPKPDDSLQRLLHTTEQVDGIPTEYRKSRIKWGHLYDR